MWYKEPMQVIFKLSELSMIFEGGKKYSKGGKGKKEGENKMLSSLTIFHQNPTWVIFYC